MLTATRPYCQAGRPRLRDGRLQWEDVVEARLLPHPPHQAEGGTKAAVVIQSTEARYIAYETRLRRAMVCANSAMLARNCLFSILISEPQQSHVRCAWSRKYPMGLKCPVPQSAQTTSMVTLSNAFFGICNRIPVIRSVGL